MPPQTASTLATIFSDVLADLAFLFTDETHQDPDPNDPWVRTTIGYRGSAGGDLCFYCPRSFTALLAANLLGLEEHEVDALACEDAAKEFMNIVCGQLVTALHGTEEVFDLTIPRLEEPEEAPDLTRDDGEFSTTISVEGHRVQLRYTPQNG
jgi:CheY-specific phosphatase CheX